MRMLVLEMGTIIKTNEDWTFPLVYEPSNEKIMQTLGVFQSPAYTAWRANVPWGSYVAFGEDWSKAFTIPITIPRDTILEVDFYFANQKIPGFESIAFFINDISDPRLQPTGMKNGFPLKGRKRFYARFKHCAGMDFDIVKAVTV